MQWSARTSRGLVRPDNEDAWMVQAFSERVWLAMVADGIGGCDAGEVASSIAIKHCGEYILNNFQKYPPKELLVQAMRFGNRKVLQAAVETGAAGMGTTLTAALVLEDESKIYIGHVGDSRAYLISNGEIRQVTEDHSLAGELVRNGAITEEAAMRHPARNALTAALGTEVSVPVAIYEEDLSPGDVVILCTDGLTGLVSSKEIRDMTSVLGRKEIAQRFVDTANERGGYDNVTVVLMWPDVEGVPCG
ncbi:MAG: Stp1/IreP family PP2C-type Ser/Thr phosphatase [Bacillota bacterium]|nr:Stp1/IreP family PP2C-type Ser/Thr phosphatase [Candidatus Fermentithermobacillaceae bacterium]